MPNVERKVSIETWSVIKVVLILLGIGLLYLIRDILVLVFAAVFLAALMHPAARYLATKHIPKGVTVLVIYLFMLGIASMIVWLLLPALIDQTSGLLQHFGISWQSFSEFTQTIKQFSSEHGLTDKIKTAVGSVQSGQLFDAVGNVFSTLGGVFGGIVGLIIVLVMAFYAVVEEEQARELFHNFMPEEYKQVSATILKRVEEKIGRWLIGQLSLGLIIGLMYYIGLTLIGVKSALVLAVFGGFLEFIPYLGPILGAVPILLMALTQSPVTALFALMVLVLIQQLENHVIVPKIMQKAVGLNPLISIIALLIGAQLFGIVGMLLAIPVSTAIAVVMAETYRYSRTRKA